MTSDQAEQIILQLAEMQSWVQIGVHLIGFHWSCTFLWFVFSQMRRGPFHSS